MALRADSAFNWNEYQEYFLGVKAARAYGWQPYNIRVPIFLKSRSLSLLEPSGPIQACNGIALPSIFTFIYLPSKLRYLNNQQGHEITHLFTQ
jgi:hypothetical protein